MNVWDALRDALGGMAGARPENSVTPDEFAAKAGCSKEYARAMLAANPELEPRVFKTPDGRRAKCYVLRTA